MVFLDWEHCAHTADTQKRRIVNDSFKRLVSSTAAYMATEKWHGVGESIHAVAVQWFQGLTDLQIRLPSDPDMLADGLQGVFNSVMKFLPALPLSRTALASMTSPSASSSSMPPTSPASKRSYPAEVMEEEVADYSLPYATEDSDDDARPSVEDLLVQIRELYEVFCPEKLANWDEMCGKHAGAEADWLRSMKARFICPGNDSEAAKVVRQHVEANRGRFRGQRCDGSSGPQAKHPRMDYETRVNENQWVYEHTASRSTGDSTAALLLAYHSVVKPLAKERCPVNPRTGVHLESIENNEGKWVSNNHDYIIELFRRVLGDDVHESQWFQLHHVRRIIDAMLVEVCKQEKGKWQWRGFYLEDHEWDELPFEILKAFLAGVEAWCD